MRLVGGRVLKGWRAVAVPLLGLALLVSACDTGGSSAPGGIANATSPPAETSPAIDLPDALMTEVVAGSGRQTPSAVPAAVSEDDRETIYGLVVLSLVRGEAATTVYLNPFLGQGERLDESEHARPVGESLSRYMDSVDGERQYFMSEFADAVGPLEEGGKVKDGGVFVTLGEIMAAPEGTDIVAVRGSIFRGIGDAEGNLYRFQTDDTAPDGWKLLDVQQEWSDN
ncbi:MAG: hypothetical protein M3437_05280 [Chloroflexota bacterium]|nr:hypothetical protein [Chloroflexota bacterium]MDQ5866973.1 hypothetical protein [Chloroflexota bacterium]